MPMHQLDRWVRRHVRRIRLGQFLGRAADFGAVFLCIFGAVVLFIKLALPQLWPQVLWLATGVIPVGLAAWCFVQRQPWDRSESVARLDRSLEAGGLLMTLSEHPHADWDQRLPQLDQLWREALPRIRPRRFVTNLTLPLVFAVATCFVPLRDASQSLFARNTPAGNEARKLEELLEKLDEAAALEPEERTQIKQELARLAEEARNKPFDSRKWESLDAIREKMHDRIDSASQIAQQAQDAVQALEEETQDRALQLTPREQAQLAALLKKMQSGGELEKAMQDAPPELQAALQQLLKSSESKPGEKAASGDKNGDKNGKEEAGKELTTDQQAALEQLLKRLQEKAGNDPGAQQAAEQIAQALQRSAAKRAAGQQRQQSLKKNLSQTLKKLRKRGAFDKASPEMRAKLDELLKGESLDMPNDPAERQQALQELKEYLAQENARMEELQNESLDGEERPGMAGQRPGKGGVQRGRADAELTWGDEAPKFLEKFKEVELPPGSGTDPKDEIMTITKTAPTEKPAAKSARGEQRNLDPSAGAVTVNRKLSPRHRSAVRRFFEDSKASPPKP